MTANPWAMAATHTLSVEGVSVEGVRPLSSSFCKKVSTHDTSQEDGSLLSAAHQSGKTDDLRV